MNDVDIDNLSLYRWEVWVNGAKVGETSAYTLVGIRDHNCAGERYAIAKPYLTENTFDQIDFKLVKA